MKRLSSSCDSLGGLMSICRNSTGEEKQGNSHVYSREYQSMMMVEGIDEEGSVEECGGGHNSTKKRRLSMDQVKALEKNFEVDNKLEPDRKIKLAQELGLQPRQVAVWFQNRRARWKTKQLERDYGILKANYDALKLDFDTLQHENESLLQEIDELKSALQDDKDESKVSVKQETIATENENKDKAKEEDDDSDDDDIHLTNYNNLKASMDDVIVEYENEDDQETELDFQIYNNNGIMGATLFTELKDGSSDSSDSSAILNEDNNNDNNNHRNDNNHTAVTPFLDSNSGYQFLNAKGSVLGDANMEKYNPQFVKIEEHNFFGGDDSCTTFFNDVQPPSLQWDCPEQWN